MDRPPAPCHRTGKDEPRPGQPFFVETTLIAEVFPGPNGPQVRPRIKPIVHAASWIQFMCDQPGSPFVLRTTEQYEREQAELAELDAVRLENEELRAELSLRDEAPPVDVEALAGALIVPLESHFARKSGRRPKTAA